MSAPEATEINLGGITIGLHADETDLRRFPAIYRGFGTSTEPDLRLHVLRGLPGTRLGAPLFDSGSNWQLYEAGSRTVIRIAAPGHPVPFAVAVLESDLRSGDVYLPSDGMFAWDYPLDELVMIMLLSRDLGLILHAFGVDDHGEGTIFVGASGAGKSTLATIWQRQPGVTLLSDDRVIVRDIGGTPYAYGTPWHGDARALDSGSAPLRRLLLIRHAPRNELRRLGTTEAVAQLLVRAFPPFWDPEGMAFILKYLHHLCDRVPCYDLGFVPDERVVDFVRNAPEQTPPL